MFTTFDRYLLRRYIHTFVILFISMFGLFVVIDGFSNIDAFQEGQNSTAGILRHMGSYYLYQSSLFFDLTGAMLAAITVMVLFALLKKHGEVSPILAAGIPTYRLLRPCLIGTVLVNVAVVGNQELVIPAVADHLQAPRSAKEDSGKSVDPITDYKTHLRIYGQRLYLKDERIEGANFVLPVPDAVNELTTLEAEQAWFRPATDTERSGWLLTGISTPYEELPLTPAGQLIVHKCEDPTELFVATDVTFDQLYNRSRSYRYCSTPELLRRIQNPAYGNATLRSQVLHLHTRLVTPVINLLAVLVAVPLVLRKESRSLIGNMAICAAVLGTLQGVVQLSQYVAKANLMAPDLAAWIPAVVTGTVAAWVSGVVQT